MLDSTIILVNAGDVKQRSFDRVNALCRNTVGRRLTNKNLVS